MPAWVLAFYRLKSSEAPTYTPCDEARLSKQLLNECAGGLADVHDASALVSCVLVKDSSNHRGSAFLIVTNGLQNALGAHYAPEQLSSEA